MVVRLPGVSVTSVVGGTAEEIVVDRQVKHRLCAEPQHGGCSGGLASRALPLAVHGAFGAAPPVPLSSTLVRCSYTCRLGLLSRIRSNIPVCACLRCEGSGGWSAGQVLLAAQGAALGAVPPAPPPSTHLRRCTLHVLLHNSCFGSALTHPHLPGRSVEVVVDGLAGKSRWLRKAPLELRHQERPVWEGRQAVLLFAGGSAAKEQWFNALARGAMDRVASPDAKQAEAGGSAGVGAAVASVEALYSAFCMRAHDVAAVPYPQVRPPVWCIFGLVK